MNTHSYHKLSPKGAMLARVFALVLALLFAGTLRAVAQPTLGSPQITCITVLDSLGNVTITWNEPDTISGIFKNYYIYASNSLTGTFTRIDSINDSSITSATFLDNNLNSSSVYFYIITSTSYGSSEALDTMSSIYLNLSNPGAGYALLEWDSINIDGPPTSLSHWYYIYREYPIGIWTLIDSTKQFLYKDTITICNAFLHYRIEEQDSSCFSCSNWPGENFSNQIKPPIPIIDTVSVSGNSVEISWNKSPKKQVIGYNVYEKNYLGTYNIVATVNSITDTSYSYTGNNPDSASLSFEITAVDSCHQESALSNSQNTIFLTESANFCNQTNTLNWNSYENLIPAVGKYEVYLSVNFGPDSLIATTASGVTTYTDSNINTTETRCYFVRVVDSLRTDTTASSNVVCYSVVTPPRPKYLYLNNATVVYNSTENMVECYVDSADSGVKYYELLRASDSNKYVAIDTLAAPPDTSFISFYDNTCNPNQQSYNYKVYAMNSCYRNIDTSNIGQTIYLTAVGEPERINDLQWNSYGNWLDNVYSYQVFRSEDGGPYSLVNTIVSDNSTQYTLQDNVSQIITGYGVFYYYIRAIENASVYPFIDTSVSNTALAYQDPNVFIPDAFNPKGKNRVFYPVGTFVNVTGYDFSIIDRWGQVIFETNEPETGWDGTYKGKLVAEGVYVYILTYTSAKGEYFERKGTVTLIK